MQLGDKVLFEIISLGVIVVVTLVLFKYMRRSIGTQTESEEDAHLKRLFGEAWQEAKKL